MMFFSSHIGKIIFVSVDHYTKLCYVVVNQYQFNVKIFSPNMYLGNIKHTSFCSWQYYSRVYLDFFPQ